MHHLRIEGFFPSPLNKVNIVLMKGANSSAKADILVLNWQYLFKSLYLTFPPSDTC